MKRLHPEGGCVDGRLVAVSALVLSVSQRAMSAGLGMLS